MELSIRNFKREDQAEVRALILDGLGEHFGFVDYTMNPDIDDIWSNYMAAGNKFFVAEMEGRIVGTAALLEQTSYTGRIVRMSVDIGMRRLGIGRRLMDAVKSEAKRRGYTELVLSTEVGWDAAIGLYRSCGFIETGRNEVDVHMVMYMDR